LKTRACPSWSRSLSTSKACCIERVSTAAMIDTIEDRIQWLDFQLSDASDSGLNEEQTRRLWRERVELMDSLVKVRYAEGGVTF
jgi:hypothetical protein